MFEYEISTFIGQRKRLNIIHSDDKILSKLKK